MSPHPIPDRTRRAKAQKRCLPNICLRTVRTWIGVGAKFTSARRAWAGAQHKHPGDKHPPEGVPVFFGKPSALRDPFQHIAYSLGGGRIRTTDWPRTYVNDTTIDELARRWGKPYLGWTEDLNGTRVWHRPS